MKKFISILCFMVLTVSLVGCGNKELNKSDLEVKPNKNISESAHKVVDKANEISDKKNETNSEISDDTLLPDEVTSSAMFVPIGDWFLFIGETGPFTLIGEDIEYLDIDGNAITNTDLVAGNKVEITSAGMMLESYPGQLAGVTKVQITEVGSPEDISEYQDIIDELSQGFDDEATAIPVMNINYKTELANVSVLVEPNGGYQFNNDTNVEIGDALPIEESIDSLPIANIGEKVDMELTFSTDVISVSANKMNTSEDFTEVEIEKNDNSYVIKDITVGTYVVYAEFANGDVEYRFICEE